MSDQNYDKAFLDELNRRISILTDPDYSDPSLQHLKKVDYLLMALLIVFSLIIMAWGWF